MKNSKRKLNNWKISPTLEEHKQNFLKATGGYLTPEEEKAERQRDTVELDVKFISKKMNESLKKKK